ncbi:hypothetical protein VTI74DRAFT_10550 [Chaetomium olivicolor]
MTRNRCPPRRSSRASEAGKEADRGARNSGGTEANTEGVRYDLAAAQQAAAAPGPRPVQYPAAPVVRPPATPRSGAETSLVNPPQEDIRANDYDPPFADPRGRYHGNQPPTATLSEYPYSIYNHGTWTADDDQILIQARSRGQNWADLQRTHFPTKTANACRKRYERLVERRGIHDYSGRRLEYVASEYMKMRKELWSRLADRVGMKWEAVEAMCMGSGLRTIQSNARSYTNRARRDSRISQNARDATQADVETGLSISTGLPPPGSLPAGAAFEEGFEGYGIGPPDRAQEVGQRNDAELMPPPPSIPSGRPPSTGRLPPIAPAPPGHFPGYVDNSSRSGYGQPRLGPPAEHLLGTDSGWRSTTSHGPI